jgi:hypothetical protein
MAGRSWTTGARSLRSPGCAPVTPMKAGALTPAGQRRFCLDASICRHAVDSSPAPRGRGSGRGGNRAHADSSVPGVRSRPPHQDLSDMFRRHDAAPGSSRTSTSGPDREPQLPSSASSRLKSEARSSNRARPWVSVFGFRNSALGFGLRASKWLARVRPSQ